MAARPVAIPELFSGEGKARWDDWIDHFEWDARGVARILEKGGGGKDNVIAREARKIFVTRSHTY